MSKPKVLICPYCGETQGVREACEKCGGLFEPLSRQATHNAMGPWFVRNEERPYQPGCSYEMIVALIERGKIGKHTIIRGPTTKQFWNVARRVPGVAHLFGFCHNCAAPVVATDHGCHACGTPFGAYLDRNYLGLPEIRPLPWEADAGEEIHGRAPMPAIRTMSGISSFASDAELTGAATAAAERAALNLPSPSSRSEHQTPDAGNGDDRRQSQLSRSMQRRVDQQARTIRLLLIVLAICVVSVLVVAVFQLGPRLMGDVEPGPVAADTLPPAEETPPEPAEEEPPVVVTEPQLPVPAEPGPEAQWSAEWDRALTLTESGADPARERAARIEDYVNALAIIDRIRADVPAEQRPADLDTRRAEIEEALERLKLEEFFP